MRLVIQESYTCSLSMQKDTKLKIIYPKNPTF
jgi:hypothetical protein